MGQKELVVPGLSRDEFGKENYVGLRQPMEVGEVRRQKKLDMLYELLARNGTLQAQYFYRRSHGTQDKFLQELDQPVYFIYGPHGGRVNEEWSFARMDEIRKKHDKTVLVLEDVITDPYRYEDIKTRVQKLPARLRDTELRTTFEHVKKYKRAYISELTEGFRGLPTVCEDISFKTWLECMEVEVLPTQAYRIALLGDIRGYMQTLRAVVDRTPIVLSKRDSEFRELLKEVRVKNPGAAVVTTRE
ncbi:MAG: hypothetical protein V1744_00930 [Candidatus Altiarchaeota archaeon]